MELKSYFIVIPIADPFNLFVFPFLRCFSDLTYRKNGERKNLFVLATEQLFQFIPACIKRDSDGKLSEEICQKAISTDNESFQLIIFRISPRVERTFNKLACRAIFTICFAG